MNIKNIPLNQAIGHILLHNQIGTNGRRVLKKGHILTEQNIAVLQSLGLEQVYVAILDEDDVSENEAAQRLGEIITSDGIITSKATTGRLNFIADQTGLLKIDNQALLTFNEQTGITLATLPTNSVAQPKTMLATVKIIPYSIPQKTLLTAETIAQKKTLFKLNPFVVKKATLIATGSLAAKQKILNSFTPSLQDRLSTYNTEMLVGQYVAEQEESIGQALQAALNSDTQMILIVGETSIMDIDDITPRAIKSIGGEIVHYGVPVEPGNLLLLAYYKDIPIVGAPGCARSKKYNVVDIVLPRLAAGERLTRQDLVALGHGGFLK